jgi:hypothetical protein
MSRSVKRIVKKAWIACLLALIALVFGLYFLRRETYFLNKNVRLVGMRINLFEELSLHRHCRYKMQFQRDHYQVYLLLPGSTNEWKEVVTYPYQDEIETSTPGFAIEIDGGGVVSYRAPDKGGKERPHLVLGFLSAKTPLKKSGILFLQGGDWRILPRFSGAE